MSAGPFARVRRARRLAALLAAGFATAAFATALTVPPPTGWTRAGMVYFAAGTMRTRTPEAAGQIAARDVRLSGYFLDARPVTRGEFHAFAAATGHVTFAESVCGAYQRITDPRQYDVRYTPWIFDKKANWKTPLGDDQQAPDDHPVTQVSFHDAEAYCAFHRRRLPSEAEWEYAARNGGRDATLYPWGTNELLSADGRPLANTWEPVPSLARTPPDGYIYTSPVGRGGHSRLGLSDMAGNVWEWTSTDYVAGPYSVDHGFMQPADSGASEKVLKGGSFLCHRQACHGFTVFARNHMRPATATYHVGFRCARLPGQIDNLLGLGGHLVRLARR